MSDKLNQALLDMWHEFRTMVDALEQDVNKNARGVSAAGVRARKGFRLLKKKLSEAAKNSLEAEHEKKKEG